MRSNGILHHEAAPHVPAAEVIQQSVTRLRNHLQSSPVTEFHIDRMIVAVCSSHTDRMRLLAGLTIGPGVTTLPGRRIHTAVRRFAKRGLADPALIKAIAACIKEN